LLLLFVFFVGLQLQKEGRKRRKIVGAASYFGAPTPLKVQQWQEKCDPLNASLKVGWLNTKELRVI
jgi:hypothetical protein